MIEEHLIIYFGIKVNGLEILSKEDWLCKGSCAVQPLACRVLLQSPTVESPRGIRLLIVWENTSRYT